MALLKANHLSPFQIQKDFVYKAKLGGILPVYLGDLSGTSEDAMPHICEVNGCPTAFLDMTFFLLGWTQMLMDYMHIPCKGYPLTVIARLDGQPLERDDVLNQFNSEDM